MIAALIVIIAAAVPLPGRVGAGWPDAWVTIGIILAAAAVGGTIWNGWQLYRHVSLAKRDADGRLRPLLGWTVAENLPMRPIKVYSGALFRVRIINAGQVAATGIVCDIKCGMVDDFEAGRAKRKRDRYGSLAPNNLIELHVPITEEQMRAAEKRQSDFRIEILAEYGAPGKNTYSYSLVGDYDGDKIYWRD